MQTVRIQDGRVVEIILPFVRLEENRPPAPPEIEEGQTLTPEEQFAWDQQMAAHTDYQVGEVPLAERFHPTFLTTLHEVPDSVQIGDVANGDGTYGAYVPPPPTLPAVLAERDARLREAALRIAPLQDAVDIGEATEEDEAALLAWKQYRVKLSRIHLLPGYHTSFMWPTEPVAPNGEWGA